MLNETDSQILAGLAAIPEFVKTLQRINERLDAIDAKLNTLAVKSSSSNKKKFLTVKEAAETMSIGQASVRRLIQRKLLQRSLALRKILIPVEDIEKFLARTT